MSLLNDFSVEPCHNGPFECMDVRPVLSTSTCEQCANLVLHLGPVVCINSDMSIETVGDYLDYDFCEGHAWRV